jgi:hypothetical protein
MNGTEIISNHMTLLLELKNITEDTIDNTSVTCHTQLDNQ